ncbi:hypothetical protein Gpo141_00007864 [Globisporangium polare]
MGDDTAAALATMTAAVTATIPPPPPSADAYHPHPLSHQQLQPQPQSPGLPLRRFSAIKGKTGRQSSKFGTVNYSIDEMRRLNEKVRAVMPIAGEDWLHVAYQFNYMRPESIPYREVESLKRKFKKMYCSRSSSVSGRLPEYIEEAKTLRRLINVRSEKAQLETSDTHSEVDVHDMASGLGEQSQQLANGKTYSFAPPSVLDDSQSSAIISQSGNSTPGGQQVQTEEVEASETPAPVNTAADTLAADHSQTHHEELQQETVSLVTQQQNQEQQQELPASATEPFASEAEINDSRVIACKLSEMEEEYRRAMATTRRPSQGLAEIATSLVASASNSQQLSNSVATAPASTETDAPDSTSGIISMLKHSIERKRRTMEEQMLSESERVRKERKKRKMEQVLFSIHQEQRERELANASLEATAASILGVSHSVGLAAAAGAPGVASAAQSSSSSLGPQPPQLPTEPSVGVMEIVLQYMVAQQAETARRLQEEQMQREREQQAKEQRRREKERQRRQERREFMLVMAAALDDKFPSSLKHLLDGPPDDVEFVEEESNATAAAVAEENEQAARDASSTTSEEVAEHFESETQAGDQLAADSSHENEPTLI